MLKYSQNYNFPVFYFVSLEAGTVTFKIFCLMIPSLVDTSLDFGFFRVVRPYGCTFSADSYFIGDLVLQYILIVSEIKLWFSVLLTYVPSKNL